MKKIMVPLAYGLEEIEAIAGIDVLRRADIEVITVSLGDLKVKGAHDIIVLADKSIDEVDVDEFDGILLPGGMPGSTNLRDDKRVINMIKSLNESGKLVSAICAAPIVLERAGVLKGRKATGYPGFDGEMPSCNYTGDRVVVDNNVITGKGPGAALEFAFEVVNYLVGEETVNRLKEEMIMG
ncbi:MAG: DJ-1/PfpI family protein [Alkaliphilus sp.]|nr:DJ-1/PfpI family protein [Alkaliphilus sp.]